MDKAAFPFLIKSLSCFQRRNRKAAFWHFTQFTGRRHSKSSTVHDSSCWFFNPNELIAFLQSSISFFLVFTNPFKFRHWFISERKTYEIGFSSVQLIIMKSACLSRKSMCSFLDKFLRATIQSRLLIYDVKITRINVASHERWNVGH